MSEHLTRKDLVEHYARKFEDVAILGLGESWDEGFIALTANEGKAKKALLEVLRENYGDDNIELMEKKTSAFKPVKDLYGNGDGWQLDHSKSASPKITYWMIDLDY